MASQNPFIDQGSTSTSASASANPNPATSSAAKQRKSSTTKITRNRKINSCLACRDKKQKCDRVHPICGTCASSKNPAGCVYVDDTFVATSNKGKAALAAAAAASNDQPSTSNSNNTTKRKVSFSTNPNGDANRIDNGEGEGGNGNGDERELANRMSKIMGKEKEASLFAHGNEVYFAGPNSSTSYLERRRQLIPTNLLDQAAQAQQQASSSQNPISNQPITSRYFSFEERIRSTRSLAIGEVLEENQLNGSLKLPDFETLLYILEAYQNNIEWHYDFQNVGLLLPRIKDFHDWWIEREEAIENENQQRMDGNWNDSSSPILDEDELMKNLPPDPVLVPLLFAILAIGLQCIRTCGSKERGGNGVKERSNENPSFPSSTSTSTTSNFSKDSRMDFLSQSKLLPNSFSKYTPRSKSSPPSHRLFKNCSSEKEFLKISLECSESLQTSCPSNFSSAYQAPLDLIRSNLLIGIWHTSELNLQFACSAFAISTRLAHSAGLNRDPKMWGGKIDKIEAFNRRTLWWSVVFFSVFHSSRLGIPPDLRPNGFDTELPNDFKTKVHIWKKVDTTFQREKLREELEESANNAPVYTSSYSSSTTTAKSKKIGLYSSNYISKFPKLYHFKPPSYESFQFHLCRYKLAHCFLLQNEKLFGLKLPRHEIVEVLDLVYTKWRKEVPDFLKKEWLGKDSIKSPSPDPTFSGGNSTTDSSPDTDLNHHEQDSNSRGNEIKTKEELILEENEKDIEMFQSFFLQIGYLQGTLQIHRPYLDEGGGWKEPKEAKKSLEMCLNAACSLIWAVNGMLDKGPPHWTSNIMVQHTFSSSSILAIHIQVQENVALHSRSSSNDQQNSGSNVLKVTLQKGLEILDTFHRKKTFGNIAEQAGRFAGTIRELLGYSPQEGSIGPGGAASQIRSNNTPSNDNSRIGNQLWEKDPRAGFLPTSTDPALNKWENLPTPTPFSSYYNQPPPQLQQQQQQSQATSNPNPALNLPPFDPSLPANSFENLSPGNFNNQPQQALSPASAAWLFRPLEGIPPDRPLPGPPGKGNSPLPSRVLNQDRPMMDLGNITNPIGGFGINQFNSGSNNVYQGLNPTPSTFSSLPQQSFAESNYSNQNSNGSNWNSPSNDSNMSGSGSVGSRNNSAGYDPNQSNYTYNYPMTSLSEAAAGFDVNSNNNFSSVGGNGMMNNTIPGSSTGSYNYALNSTFDFVGNDAVDYVQEWKLWESYCEDLKNQRNENA